MKRKRSRKKKVIVITLISILAISFVIVAILIIISLSSKEKLTYLKSITIEVGDSLPTIEDLKINKDGVTEITWQDLEEKDGKVYKLGTYTGTFTYKEEEKEVTLIVKDTKSPVIEGVKDIEMLAYENRPDLLKDITASDNSGEKIEVTIEGECDTTKVGQCEMTYVATDSSGNKETSKFKLIVKENPNIKESKTSKGFTLKTNYGVTTIDDVVIANKTYSLPSTYVPSNLVTINGYVKVIDYAASAFNKLQSDATALGLNIYASSGYRSYNDQKYIYNNYVARDGKESADTYSARAGYSEHQTGLVIDVNSVDMSFDNTSESNFLRDNCYKYGFIIRYPKGKEGVTGYMYEPWHLRYVGVELATKIYNNGNWTTLEEYFGIDSKYN